VKYLIEFYINFTSEFDRVYGPLNETRQNKLIWNTTCMHVVFYFILFRCSSFLSCHCAMNTPLIYSLVSPIVFADFRQAQHFFYLPNIVSCDFIYADGFYVNNVSKVNRKVLRRRCLKHFKAIFIKLRLKYGAVHKELVCYFSHTRKWCKIAT